MEAVGLHRLLTHDLPQVTTALLLGFGVLVPRGPRHEGNFSVTPHFPQMGDSLRVEFARSGVPISPQLTP
jgi:hypothetical protein